MIFEDSVNNLQTDFIRYKIFILVIKFIYSLCLH